MTDHGIALLGRLAGQQGSSNTRDLADNSGIPVTTTAKILKQLQDGGLLLSQRGMHGGYRLARAPEHITLCQIVEVMEGPLAMSQRNCITRVVADAFVGLTLAEILRSTLLEEGES